MIDPARISWRKSSYSGANNACVEVADLPAGTAVRDTKNRAVGYFTATGPQWQAFLAAIKTGRFDH